MNGIFCVSLQSWQVRPCTARPHSPFNPSPNTVTIHLAFNIDRAYITYCLVTLISIFRNNRSHHIVAHILSRGLTGADKDNMVSLLSEYDGELHFYEPDEHLLDGFRIDASSSHISLVTYYRCMLADYLPADIDRVIYLDCDILVNADIAPLWETPLNGAPLAAVADAAADDAARYEVLCYPQADGYFNAGVLLIDLEWWRRHDVGRRCIDYYHKHPERIRFNDQDLLNSLFHGQVCWVSVTYNAQEGFYRPRYAGFDAHRDELLHPVVTHFTNRKPWHWASQHPQRSVFFLYQSYLPVAMRDEEALSSRKLRLARWFKLLPYTLHLRKPRYRNEFIHA